MSILEKLGDLIVDSMPAKEEKDCQLGDQEPPVEGPPANTATLKRSNKRVTPDLKGSYNRGHGF